MFKLFAVLWLVTCICVASNIRAQDAAQKSKDLVAALDKTKYKKKDKGSVSVEVFVDIKNQPAVRSDATEYSGQYVSDGYQLSLTVSKDGSASGSGYDSIFGAEKPVNFALRDAKVNGALLTATKVYANGATLAFEAVFVYRTSRSGTNPNAIAEEKTEFGIGFIQRGSETQASPRSDWTNRVFLERR